MLIDQGNAWNPLVGKSSRRRSTSGSGVGWTSSERVCPTTIRTGPGPISSSRPSDGAIYEVDLLVLTKHGLLAGRVQGVERAHLR